MSEHSKLPFHGIIGYVGVRSGDARIMGDTGTPWANAVPVYVHNGLDRWRIGTTHHVQVIGDTIFVLGMVNTALTTRAQAHSLTMAITNGARLGVTFDASSKMAPTICGAGTCGDETMTINDWTLDRVYLAVRDMSPWRGIRETYVQVPKGAVGV